MSAEPLLALRGLVSHHGRIEVLHGLEVDVAEGELVALVGANGAGKTTLLRTISGVHPLSGGAVRFAGVDLARHSASARVRQGVCQVPEGRQVFGPMSVEDNLRLGGHTRRDRAALEIDLHEMFALFPILQQFRRRLAGSLSGGQQQMLALARALMGRPRLLLLDEPSMGLAPLVAAEIFAFVQRLRADGRTILIVEQNAQAVLAIADRAYVLETGRIVGSGSGQDLLDNSALRSAYLGM